MSRLSAEQVEARPQTYLDELLADYNTESLYKEAVALRQERDELQQRVEVYEGPPMPCGHRNLHIQDDDGNPICYVCAIDKSNNDFRQERDMWCNAEIELSKAYLRLRTILDAYDTPFGPTAEQVWAHTEEKAKALVAERDAFRLSLAEVIADLEERSNHKQGSDQGVVDIGNGVYYRARKALGK